MNKLKQLREFRNWSQARLGKEMNCAGITISRYETGQRELDSETINKLCDIFGCTSDYLLGRSLLPTAELTEEEATLLLAYRAADPHIKTGILALLEPYKQEKATSAS